MPTPLANLVMRCLEKKPVGRPESAQLVLEREGLVDEVRTRLTGLSGPHHPRHGSGLDLEVARR